MFTVFEVGINRIWPGQSSVSAPQKPPDNKKVFVVHGHNGGLKNAVARSIEKLGLEAKILHEQPDRGRTVIDKFEAESHVGYAVVLATADDIGESAKALKAHLPHLSEDDLKRRARQNVIYELGFFVGKLSRERVLLITDDNLELPSDLSGVVYSRTNEWQLKLVESLTDAEYEFSQKQIREAQAIR